MTNTDTLNESQLDFAIRMKSRYLTEKNVRSVGVRRLHYFIVSLPENERMLNGKKGDRHPYENTPNQYKQLSKLLGQARVRKLINSEDIIDEKNVALIEMPERQSSGIAWTITPMEIVDLPDLNINYLPEWNEWLNNFKFKPTIYAARFNNQKYRIVVCIEKATSKKGLTELCETYGADLLIFSGQFSITRVYDIVKRAQNEDKPILLLYISDLDCGGWVMPSAFYDRIQEIYPHHEHKLVRVALTRDLVKKYNLPTAFEPSDKGYSQVQIDKFIKESGGHSCTELDALDEPVLLSLLEEELIKYSGKDLDRKEEERMSNEADKIVIETGLENSPWKEEYEQFRIERNTIVTKLKEITDKYKDKIEEFNNMVHTYEEMVSEEIERSNDLDIYYPPNE